MMVKSISIQLFILICISLQGLGQDLNPDLIALHGSYVQGDYQGVLTEDLNIYGEDEQELYFKIKGESAYQLGDIDQAIQWFKKVENISRGGAAIELSRCYKYKDDKALMFKYLADHLNSEYKLPRKEIMLDPVFSDMDRDREWIRFWSDSWYKENENLLAEAQYQIKQENQDEEFWLNLSQNQNNDAALLMILGRYYDLIGEKNQAEQVIDMAISMDSDNLDLNIQYVNYLIEKSDFDKAILVISRMIDIYPYEIRLYQKRLLAIFQSGQTSRGIEEINRLENLGIDASDMYFLLAGELMKVDPQSALQYLNSLLETNPTSPSFNLRAQARKTVGDDQGAISDLAMSLDINPKQPDVYFLRAELRLKRGDRDGACYDWQNALNLGHRKAADMLFKYCNKEK